MYFVHSYRAAPTAENQPWVLATCGTFPIFPVIFYVITSGTVHGTDDRSIQASKLHHWGNTNLALAAMHVILKYWVFPCRLWNRIYRCG